MTTDARLLVSSTSDPIPAKQWQPLTVWPTVGSQMSLAWMPSNELLYSGSETGEIYAWKIQEQACQETLRSHKDMVLSLLALNTTNNLVSASMDATIAVWDTYTHMELFKLKGHRKGIFGLSYNPDYRLLVSCGFDHDAMVWSPFVKSLVFRLKGHHASLIGCQCVEDSPEIITADIGMAFEDTLYLHYKRILHVCCLFFKMASSSYGIYAISSVCSRSRLPKQMSVRPKRRQYV